MGDSGPTHEVGTFSSHADDLRLGEIMSVVYSKDILVIWSTGIHIIGYGPKVYGALLEEFPKGYGHTADHEYNFPPTDGWSV